jgi:hypothetical protein
MSDLADAVGYDGTTRWLMAQIAPELARRGLACERTGNRTGPSRLVEWAIWDTGRELES